MRRASDASLNAAPSASNVHRRPDATDTEAACSAGSDEAADPKARFELM